MDDASQAAPQSAETTSENKVWYLQKNRLFANSPLESVDNAQHLFRIVLMPKRTMIFDHSDATRLIYLVKRGRVRIVRLTPDGKEVTVAILGPGDMFGEDSLFGHASRTTVAVCMEETLVCTAAAADLLGLLSDNPKLALNVAEILSDRLGSASATIEDLATAKVADRIMHLFRRLAAEHGRNAPDGGVSLDVRLTHSDIASLIGSTRETVSLEMAALVRAGRIQHDGRFITVPERELHLS